MVADDKKTDSPYARIITRRVITEFDNNFLASLANNNELTKKDYRIVMYLMSILDDTSFIQVRQVDISKILKMDKTSVSLSIKHLIELSIIERAPATPNVFRFKRLK